MNSSEQAKSEHPSIKTAQRQQLLGIGLASLIGWAAWSIALFNLDPFSTTSVSLLFFSISLFMALIGTFTLVGFGLRLWMSKESVEARHINIALRQGVLLSFCTLLCIGFLILNILKWWNGLLIVSIAVLIEAALTRRV